MSITIRNVKDAWMVRVPARRSPNGTALPPKQLRMGGEHFLDDEELVKSATLEVERLVRLAGLSPSSAVLDWGCGAGRLAIGLIELFGTIGSYRGVDVQRPLIQWADRNLGKNPAFKFTHVDIANPRYNPDGRPERRIPAESNKYDVFYAYSVFSHLMSVDATAYMGEIERVLLPSGRALITAFVEDGVPMETENPSDYGPMQWQGALHCVRFERAYFESMISDAGLAVAHFEHGQETDGQSLYVLGKAL